MPLWNARISSAAMCSACGWPEAMAFAGHTKATARPSMDRSALSHWRWQHGVSSCDGPERPSTGIALDRRLPAGQFQKVRGSPLVQPWD